MFRSMPGHVLVTVPLALVLGCGPISETQPTIAAVARPDVPDNLTYDFGRVTAGAVLTHDFEIWNHTTQVLSVVKDSDITKSCGCAELNLASHALEAGGSTRASLVVHTTGRSGTLAIGGRIKWTATDGTQRSTSLSLRGILEQPLTLKPDVVHFEPSEITAGAEKEVLITCGVALVPGTLKFSFEPLETPLTVGSHTPDALRITIRCKQIPDLETYQGHLLVTARTNEQDVYLPGQVVTARIPVTVRQKTPLALVPTILPLKFSPDGVGRARLMLMGGPVFGEEKVVRGASCAGWDVEWKVLERTPDQPVIIAFQFHRRGEGNSLPKVLELDLYKNGIVPLPIAAHATQ